MVYSQPIADVIMLLIASSFLLKVLHGLKEDSGEVEVGLISTSEQI